MFPTNGEECDQIQPLPQGHLLPVRPRRVPRMWHQLQWQEAGGGSYQHTQPLLQRTQNTLLLPRGTRPGQPIQVTSLVGCMWLGQLNRVASQVGKTSSHFTSFSSLLSNFDGGSDLHTGITDTNGRYLPCSNYNMVD